MCIIFLVYNVVAHAVLAIRRCVYVSYSANEFFRFFRQFLALFAVHLASTSMCRFVASIFRTMVAASTFGFLALILMFMLSGFILPLRKSNDPSSLALAHKGN